MTSSAKGLMVDQFACQPIRDHSKENCDKKPPKIFGWRAKHNSESGCLTSGNSSKRRQGQPDHKRCGGRCKQNQREIKTMHGFFLHPLMGSQITRSPDLPMSSVVCPDIRLSCGNLLVLVLELIQLPVNSTMREQLLVAADFADPTFMHDDDFVSPLNR
jgi:hypothetical protein